MSIAALEGFPGEITPSGLMHERKMYLYLFEKIRGLCREGTGDIICPGAVERRTKKKEKSTKMLIFQKSIGLKALSYFKELEKGVFTLSD